MAEQEIGVITRYFDRIGVAAIDITAGSLRVGDTIRIEGQGGELEMAVDSIQLDRAQIEEAVPGQEVGIKVPSPVRRKDLVYKIVD
ncbi:MAG: translation elongation factor-like protein [Actinobacteria bacterium]|nr:translation elongation factor-like protein [Actinomycetota bacterium]